MWLILSIDSDLGTPDVRTHGRAPLLKDRVPGDAKGLFVVPDDFDDPLPPELQRYFDGEGDDD